MNRYPQQLSAMTVASLLALTLYGCGAAPPNPAPFDPSASFAKLTLLFET